MHTYAHTGGAIRDLTAQPADLQAHLFALHARLSGSWHGLATVRAQIATDCCCWHASQTRRGESLTRPADALAADCCWLSLAAKALPGGRGRGSTGCPPVRTLRTRTRTSQMAVCVRGHITAKQNQIFESRARGVMGGRDMWLGAWSVRELSLTFSPTDSRRVRGLPFFHLQELLDRLPTRWRSNLFMYLSATCPERAVPTGSTIMNGCMPCVPSCMCATSQSMINV